MVHRWQLVVGSALLALVPASRADGPPYDPTDR
jgi:hypothetical protein